MNADMALAAFAQSDEAVPSDAIRWALDHWALAGPRFAEKIIAFLEGRDRRPHNEDAMFYAIHCSAERRTTALFKPLCAWLADPESGPEDTLGDAIIETLPAVLTATFDGDLEPLRRLIEAADADEFARTSAIYAFAYLARAGAMEDNALRAYWRRLERTLSPRGPSEVWSAWAATSAWLGYGDHWPLIEELNGDGRLDGSDFDREGFDALLARARSTPDGLAVFIEQMVAPFWDTVGTFERWAAEMGENGEAEDDGEGDLPPLQPHENLYRDVGRNDQCPCGSGKKFKKCHFGAQWAPPD